MIRNYFKTALRSLRSSPFLSLIHIIGLATGVTACALIFQYVHFENSFDKFHEHADDIYRVPIRYSEGFGPWPRTAANHPATGPTLYQEFSSIKAYARVLHPSNIGANVKLTSISRSGQKVSASEDNVFMTDSSFFEIFSHEFIYGDPETALDHPDNIVLTAPMALRYFGSTDVVGKELIYNDRNRLQVTGVIAKVPDNAHLQFDAVYTRAFMHRAGVIDSWIWPEFHTYLLLEPGTDPQTIEARLPAIIDKHMTNIHKEYGFQTYFSLQPLIDIHLKSDCANELSAAGSTRTVRFLSLLGIIVLLLAWINYLNLASARSTSRAREVGVRKVVGALRIQLVMQFIVEASLVCATAICIGLFAANALLHPFSELVQRNIGNALIGWEHLSAPRNLLIILAGIVLSGILAGIYPALVLSAFRPAQVLKGTFSRSRQGVHFRRGLVSIQMALSILLIGGTLLVTTQLSFMNSKDLGYSKDQILVVRAPLITDSLSYVAANAIPDRVATIGAVSSVSRSSEVPGRLIAFRNQTRTVGALEEEGASTYLQSIDDKYLETFEVDLVAGRNYVIEDRTNPFDSTLARILINETLSGVYGFDSPEEAIGQQVLWKLGEEFRRGEILGVVADYHQRSLREAYDPILYYFPSYDNWRYYSISLKPGDWSAALAEVKAIYANHFPGDIFEYFFLDEYFDRQYRADQQFAKVCRTMALLAVFVAGLGFLALSMLVISQRRKEIGVRKILGAKSLKIMMLISREFMVLLLIAQLLSLPFMIHFGKGWLDGFAFSVGMNWYVFAVPVILFVVIILSILGVQLVRSSALDPVHALKQES